MYSSAGVNFRVRARNMSLVGEELWPRAENLADSGNRARRAGGDGASGTDTNAEQFDVFSSMGADLRRLYAASASIPKALETARVEESGGGDRPFPLACTVRPRLEGRVLGGLNRG